MIDSKHILPAILVVFLAVHPVHGHEDDEPWSGDISTLNVPQNIDLFTFLRFTRLDHKIVATKMDGGATHHIGTMSAALTRATVAAGQENPRAVARLVFDMSELTDWDARNARLTAELAKATSDENAAYIIPLLELWLTNPQDGAGS